MSQSNDQIDQLCEILKARNAEKSLQFKYVTVLTNSIEQLSIYEFEKKVALILELLNVADIIQLWNFSIARQANNNILNIFLTTFHKYVDTILTHDEIIKSINYSTVKNITSSEIINIDEGKLFEFVAKRIYLGNDFTTQEIDSILNDIRFEAMSQDFLLSVVRKTKLISDDRLLDIITQLDSNLLGMKRLDPIQIWVAPSGTYKEGYKTIRLGDITPKFIKIFTKHVNEKNFKPLEDFEIPANDSKCLVEMGVEFITIASEEIANSFTIRLERPYGFFFKGKNIGTNLSTKFDERKFLIDPAERTFDTYISLYVRKNINF